MSGGGEHFVMLDGLRSVAALLVLAISRMVVVAGELAVAAPIDQAWIFIAAFISVTSAKPSATAINNQ